RGLLRGLTWDSPRVATPGPSVAATRSLRGDELAVGVARRVADDDVAAALVVLGDDARGKQDLAQVPAGPGPAPSGRLPHRPQVTGAEAGPPGREPLAELSHQQRPRLLGRHRRARRPVERPAFIAGVIDVVIGAGGVGRVGVSGADVLRDRV